MAQCLFGPSHDEKSYLQIHDLVSGHLQRTLLIFIIMLIGPALGNDASNQTKAKAAQDAAHLPFLVDGPLGVVIKGPQADNCRYDCWTQQLGLLRDGHCELRKVGAGSADIRCASRRRHLRQKPVACLIEEVELPASGRPAGGPPAATNCKCSGNVHVQ